ncbi:AarF/ABC1/UbiB kinase family protein [Thermoleophilum album]|uniref:ABC1 kinase family protein n=1 Tax=Thermoleophilum album TaxID=29539 RepID=UPI00237C5C86|nr:AarF/ABC1/UbiB kinase family protein [Thermoleophilum album]WDT94111.1 AarF/ABC1/UbiB kinase family protein [Thermoleophilum album]
MKRSDDSPPAGRLRRGAALGGTLARQGVRLASARFAAIGRAARGDDTRAAATVEAARELARQLSRMRGAAMKIGQALSTLEPLGLPPEAREEVRRAFAQLRDSARSVPFASVERVVADELGGPLSRHFRDFDREPLAAASIGQVHRAVTRGGDVVAVKVQYPGVAEAVEADLRNLGLLAPLVRRIAPGLDVRAVLREIRERIGDELDYELEAQNQRRVWRAWRGHPFAAVPAVFSELSSRRVLVTELVRGSTFEDVRELRAAERDRFGAIVARFFFANLARLGLALGDPHPGNYLLMPDGRVAFLDFGLVRAIPRAHLEREKALARAAIAGDARAVHRAMADLGYLPDPAQFDPDLLLAQIRAAAGWMFTRGRQRIDPEFVLRVLEEGGSPRSPFFAQMRRQTVPAPSLLMRRMEGLLLSVLGDLRATADWGGIVAEYVLDAEPVDELGRADARFWQRERSGPRSSSSAPRRQRRPRS